MSKVTYSPNSPYAKTAQSYNFLGYYVPRKLAKDSSDILYRIPAKFHLRPDLLAYELYNDPNYWWIFMILNPDEIKDPIYDFTSGRSIYIPTKNRLAQGLS